MKRNLLTLAAWITVALVCLWAVQEYFGPKITVVSYSEFVKSVNSGDVLILNVQDDQRSVIYTARDKQLYSTVSPTDLGNIVNSAIATGTTVKSMPVAKPMGLWLTLLIAIVPVLVLIFFLYRIAKKSGNGGVLDFGKNKAILTDPANNKVRLSDVISNPGEHEEAKDIVDFLKNPEVHTLAKAKFPRGILLAGPPGTGKTLVAKAIAGEAGVPFYHVAGSEFVEMFVGVGASRVRSMFEAARKSAPCIVFIDEIDAMARSRNSGSDSGGNRESDQTLMQLLVEMDGFEENSGIIILAATNRADVLDPALTRPGRFDRIIEVSLPDVSARQKILDLNLLRINRGDDIDTLLLARGTSGFSGADLANIVNEAALIIAKNRRTVVTMGDMEAAKDKIIMGAESPKKMSPEELKLTAYHEAGHTIVGLVMPEHDPVYKVSIVPRGRALGITMFIPDEDQYSLSKQKLNSKIATLLAGRVAEELIYGENQVTTGASNDLQRATLYARNMVTKWGFSKSVGLAQYVKNIYKEDSTFSESTSEKIDAEVESILQHNYDVARNVLVENLGKLYTMTEALIEHETISQDIIASIMDGTYKSEL